MDRVTQIIDWICITVGSVLGFLWGDVDPLLYALISMVALDCITGLAAAGIRKEISSKTCWVGLLRKFLILLLCAVAHVIDQYVCGTYPVITRAVELFFTVHEALSIIENAAKLNVPIPQRLLDVLAEINKESGGQASAEDIEKVRDELDDVIDDAEPDTDEDAEDAAQCEEVVDDGTN